MGSFWVDWGSGPSLHGLGPPLGPQGGGPRAILVGMSRTELGVRNSSPDPPDPADPPDPPDQGQDAQFRTSLPHAPGVRMT